MTDFISALQKAGLEDVAPAADSARIKGYLSTGNLALNWAISGKFQGGWPFGHVSEIYGDPSTGKSFLIARAIAIALDSGGVALLDDTEGAFNPVWAAASLGVDVTTLAHIKSHTIEDHSLAVIAFQEAMRAQKISTPSILALDSVALLSTRHEVEVQMEKESMTRAKQIKKHFRLQAQGLQDLTAAYIVTNHTIANIGDMWNPKTTGGGGGLKFQASVRVELLAPTKMKNDKTIVGVKVAAFIQKNRLAPPWRKVHMVIPFYEKISPVSGLVELLLDLKVLEKTPGHRLAYQGKDTGVSANVSDFWKQDNSALDLLSKHPDLIPTLDTMDWSKGVAGGEMEEESGD